MNFLKRIFQRPQETRYGGWQGPLSGQVLHGDSLVTPANAESLSTVFACVTAISSSISALPAIVYRQDGKTRQEANTGEIQALIKNGPNQWQTWPEFVELLVAQTLLRGNGLVEVVSGRNGHIEALHVIPWEWCNVQMLPNGRLVYDVYDQPGIYSPAQGKRRRLLQSDVIHIRDRSDDGIIGKSRLQRCASIIRGAQTVHDFAASAFRNGFYPSGVVTGEGVMSSAQREGLNNAFVRGFSGAQNAARAFILDQGLKWNSLTAISPEDAELLAIHHFG